MNKQKLVFDISVIAENLNPGASRSGIFFTAHNILKNLILSGKFDIYLFCNTIYGDNFFNFLKNNYKEHVNICFSNKYGKTLKKLSDLDNKLHTKKHNVLKLLLNIFVRKPIKFFGGLSKIPKFDIALSPCYVLSNKIKANKKYIILYDAIPLILPEYYPSMSLKKHWFFKLVQYIKSKPDCKYFAISEYTKKDFMKILNVSGDDIDVVYLAANENFYPEKNKKKITEIRKKYNIPSDKKYIFSLCTLEPRKNLIRAVKTFIEFIKKNKIDDTVFVLGGGHWKEFITILESEIKDLGKYSNKIIRAGYVDDADLAALYSGAEWFVYTSQYEGFGLPPLEAMKCGCPVITSNNSSLPEVVGDAGIMIDWDSDEQHIAAYEKYYKDEKYRKSMAKMGLERSKQFSWKKTVDVIISQIKRDLYE